MPTSVRWSIAIAAGLSLFQALSILAMKYEAGFYFPVDHIEMELVNLAFFLTPIIVLLLFRKSLAVVCAFTIPILVIFGGRACYAYQWYSSGVFSGGVGDWTYWIIMLPTCAAAVIFLASWITIFTIWKLYQIATRFNGFGLLRRS